MAALYSKLETPPMVLMVQPVKKWGLELIVIKNNYIGDYKYMRAVIITFSLLLALVSPAMAESYLCIQDQVVGFAYNEKQKTWGQAQFKPDKYVIKRFGDKPDNFKDGGHIKWPAWKVLMFGSKIPYALCTSDFKNNGDLDCCGGGFGGGVVGCSSQTDTIFKFNRNTLRFLESSIDGYYDQGNDYKPPEPTDEEIKKRDAEIKTLPEQTQKFFEELDRKNKEAAEEKKKRGSDPELSPYIAIGVCSKI